MPNSSCFVFCFFLSDRLGLWRFIWACSIPFPDWLCLPLPAEPTCSTQHETNVTKFVTQLVTCLLTTALKSPIFSRFRASWFSVNLSEANNSHQLTTGWFEWVEPTPSWESVTELEVGQQKSFMYSINEWMQYLYKLHRYSGSVMDKVRPGGHIIHPAKCAETVIN